MSDYILDLRAAASFNFVLQKGDTQRTEIDLADENNGPLDLTGCTANLQLFSQLSDTVPKAELKTSDSTIILGASKFTITSWAGMPNGTWVYKFFVTYPDTTVATYLKVGIYQAVQL